MKQIPHGVNKRLSELSCDKKHFDRAKPDFEKALKESGHNVKLAFEDSEYPAKKKRNVGQEK